MLFLHFRLGDDSFALAAERIVEMLSLMPLRTIRQAPAAVVGLLEYRDRFVPVVDICALELGRPAHRRLSTRIAVVRHPADEAALFGLIAEQATEMLRFDAEDFAPFASGPHGPVQRIDLANLLPQPLLTYLSGESAKANEPVEERESAAESALVAE
jgi:chemotaxis-related protein WspB